MLSLAPVPAPTPIPAPLAPASYGGEETHEESAPIAPQAPTAPEAPVAPAQSSGGGQYDSGPAPAQNPTPIAAETYHGNDHEPTEAEYEEETEESAPVAPAQPNSYGGEETHVEVTQAPAVASPLPVAPQEEGYRRLYSTKFLRSSKKRRAFARARGSKTFADPKCNNEDLREILLKVRKI